jgi:hypothetical protein
MIKNVVKMNIKKILFVSLILAILTIGAVSASDDIADDVISEDADDAVISEDIASDDDLAADTDDSAIESVDDDNAIEAVDDDNALEAADSEDVLESHGTYNGYDYWTYIVGDTFNTDPEASSTVAHVEDEDRINGIVTFSIDGRQYYSKSYTAAEGYSNVYVYTSDIVLPAGLKSGIHTVTVTYIKLGAAAISTTSAMEFRFVPKYRYIDSMSVGETNYIRVIAGSGTAGTANLYKYDTFQGRYNLVATKALSGGQAIFPIYGATLGTLDYAVGTTVAGKNYYQDDLYITVKANSPGYSASVSSKIYVGNAATVTFKGSKIYGDVDIYVDGKLVKTVEYRGGKLSESLTGLTKGTHQVTIHYGRGHDFYSKTFNVKVVKKPKAKKISLKLAKVKIRKSAKKLVIKATLKINKKKAKGKRIKFKFKGKTYKAKTNKKGIAKITIKKKVLKKLKVGKKVTYKASYGKKTVKRTVKVKK